MSFRHRGLIDWDILYGEFLSGGLLMSRNVYVLESFCPACVCKMAAVYYRLDL